MRWRDKDEIKSNLLRLFALRWPQRNQQPETRKYLRRHIEGLRKIKQLEARV